MVICMTCEPTNMDFLVAPDRTELNDLFVDGPSENLDETARNGVFLDHNEVEFFAAVETGDLTLVKSKLNDNNNPVNINAINSNGETALQIAAEKSNIALMKELLNKGANLKIALLQCVVENDLESVKVLLSDKPDPDDIGISADSYITPTILASQLGHYEIVHFLFHNNYRIDDPHKYECTCEECKSQSHMVRSKIAINRFTGLSSPVYMCLRYLDTEGSNQAEDPLSQAFGWNKKVKKRASNEPELKKEYLKLSERCKTFATDLYKGCRSTKEIRALLDIDEEEFMLSSGTKATKESRTNVVKTLRKAIESDHKEFVAHPHTQQLLNAVIYSGAPETIEKIRTKSFILNILLLLLYTMLFPLLVLVFIFLPKSTVSTAMSSPYVKFVSHLSQFLLFLILNGASALRDNHVPTALEYLIFITVVGMTVQETSEMLHHEPRSSYFFKWWNITTTVMLILYFLAAFCWILGFAITGGWSVVNYSLTTLQSKDGYQLLLLGNSFFSLAMVVSVFHLVDLCQVNSILGPLQLSLYRMLQDVLKFLLFFAAIFVAFVMGVRNLYSYYNSIQTEIARNSNKTDMRTMMADTNHQFSSFKKSITSMFWAFFDKIDLEDFNTKDKTFDITQETGKFLFAFYSICAVMVALNMLIAMMSNSYENISKDDDVQWKFCRTCLWLEFVEKGSTLPAPYNLLPNPRVIYHFFKRKLKPGKEPIPEKYVIQDDEQEERKTIIKRLVRRYFLARESQTKKELCTLKDIEQSKHEIIRALKEHQAETAKL